MTSRIAYCVTHGPTEADDNGCKRCRFNAWQRAHRAKRAAQGRCSTCSVNRPEFPNRTCNSCLEVAARSARNRKSIQESRAK